MTEDRYVPDPVDLRVAMILYAGVIRAYSPDHVPGSGYPSDHEPEDEA